MMRVASPCFLNVCRASHQSRWRAVSDQGLPTPVAPLLGASDPRRMSYTLGMSSVSINHGPRSRLSNSLADDSASGAVSRIRFLDLPIGLVEDVRRQGGDPGRSLEGFSPDFQVCFPYRGMFVWHVGRDDVVGDANQVLFVTGGEGYRISNPRSHGYAELIITPAPGVLAEMAQADHHPRAAHPLLPRRSWRASAQAQIFRARFLHWATGAAVDDLEAEEMVLALLRTALTDYVPCVSACAPTTKRLIRRAQEFLDAELAHRITLTDVARAVGASPAYLTDIFHRAEGISLHRYLTQLRLARALAELPHTDDLTTLALSLGFSSHSHFSAVFRRAFGLTPSQFRETTLRSQSPPSIV
jgi:AraC family transcriptional regulator